MATQSPSTSSGGLWKRQSSLAVDDSNSTIPAAATTSQSLSSPAEIEMGSDTAPLLTTCGSSSSARSSSSKDNVSENSNDAISPQEKMQLYGHVALSIFFFLAGYSIGPIFASAQDEAWRSQNIPYQKTAAGDVILDFELKHPLVNPPTVSSTMLRVTSIGVPLALVLMLNAVGVRRVQLRELRDSLCALFVSVGLSEAATCTLKLYVSRHRPNFYALCGFDPTTLTCQAPVLAHVHEATLSFPSGHSSLSFCGMTFLMYFLLGKVSRMANNGTTSNNSSNNKGGIRLETYKSLLGVLSCLLPWGFAFFVATSRIVDKWHHPSDVIAGSLLGIACGTVGYRAFYPNAWSLGSKGRDTLVAAVG